MLYVTTIHFKNLGLIVPTAGFYTRLEGCVMVWHCLSGRSMSTILVDRIH